RGEAHRGDVGLEGLPGSVRVRGDLGRRGEVARLQRGEELLELIGAGVAGQGRTAGAREAHGERDGDETPGAGAAPAGAERCGVHATTKPEFRRCRSASAPPTARGPFTRRRGRARPRPPETPPGS